MPAPKTRMNKGTTLTISVDDPSDRDILEAIVELVKDGFEE